MARATLTQRVEVMEHTVNDLATLPARVAAVEQELKAFRADVDHEFAKIDGRFTAIDAKIDGKFATINDQFAKVDDRFAKIDDRFANIDDRFAKVDAEFAKVDAEFAKVHAEFAVVRAEIREGDEETRRYMRVLYEDLAERIKIMGVGIEELRRRP
jgi:archaellum component FlaC